MSEVAEGVWFHPGELDLRALLQQAAHEARVPLAVQELPQHDLAAISILNRDDAIFDDDRMERVAEMISRAAARRCRFGAIPGSASTRR